MSSLEPYLPPGVPALGRLGPDVGKRDIVGFDDEASAPLARPDSRHRFGDDWGGPGDSRSALQIHAYRWRKGRRGTHEQAGHPRYAIVGIALQPTDVELIVDGERMLEGGAAPGLAVYAPAGCPIRATFRSPSDLLQLHIPTARLDGIARGAVPAFDQFDRARIWLPNQAIQRLASLLAVSEEVTAEGGALYLDGIAQAIVARLLEAEPTGEGQSKTTASLPKWRLKRVVELIESDLTGPLRLADLARRAGLSRMHFAAQFRAATGSRPHDYVLRKRIEMAETILRETETPLAEVALSVGFQTQAHFTTVFRRLVGETPGRWRQLQQQDEASGRQISTEEENRPL